jgi:uncharacterized protein (TIGR02453 family)
MDFRALLDFLWELNRNNSKEWMDNNRTRYIHHRNNFIKWLDDLDRTLAEIDSDYYPTPGRKGINRINNNLMFHPHKPVYKDHFGAGLDKAPNSEDFYIQIGIHESLIAGGIWRPNSKSLQSIREAIDYDGDHFKDILEKKTFHNMFGTLYEDQKLITTPKGFRADHQHIELLRNKTFAVVHTITENEIFSKSFKDHIVSVYTEMLPFRRYLNKAITV